MGGTLPGLARVSQVFQRLRRWASFEMWANRRCLTLDRFYNVVESRAARNDSAAEQLAPAASIPRPTSTIGLMGSAVYAGPRGLRVHITVDYLFSCYMQPLIPTRRLADTNAWPEPIKEKESVRRKKIIHSDVNTKPARASVHSGSHQSDRRGRSRYRGSRRQLCRC